MSFHASYVVICHASQNGGIPELSEKELVAKCRLGTTVKKAVLLSFFEDTRNKCKFSEKVVKFKRLVWTASNTSSEVTKPSSNCDHLLQSAIEANTRRENRSEKTDCQSETTCSRNNSCDTEPFKSTEISSKQEKATSCKTLVPLKASRDIENVLKD